MVKPKELIIAKGERGMYTEEDVIRMYEPYVKKSVKSWLRNHEFDDMMQVGRIGLIKAYRGYDISTGVSFGSYAMKSVKTTLIKASKYRKSDLTNTRFKDYEDNIVQSTRVTIPEDFGDTDDTYWGCLGIFISNEDGEMEESIVNKVCCEDIRKILTPKEYEILYKCYIKEVSPEVIAKEFGVTRQTITRWRQRIINKVRIKYTAGGRV